MEARNLSDSRIEENKVKELNQLSISYNKMLDRLSESFEMQRQFTANAAHELRTPLAVMQAQLDLYHTTGHPATDACTEKTIQMVTDQNERLSKMVKTLLDMSELQTVARDEKLKWMHWLKKCWQILILLPRKKMLFSKVFAMQ